MEITSRRSFLKSAGAAVVSASAGLFLSRSTPASAGAEEAAKIGAAVQRGVALKASSETQVISGNGFQISGVPDRVDAARVDTAKGDFTNTIGEGTEGWVAEPGKLLVGPDFPRNLIEAAGGAAEYFNPLNQFGLRTKGPEYAALPEGGFTMGSFGYVKVRIEGVLDGEVTVALDGQEGHNWFFIVRGPNGDGARDTDKNATLELSDYAPGHNEIRIYPGKPPGGFVSEEQFLQMVGTSANGGTNCGDGGCSKLSVFMLNINNGAYAAVTRDAPDQPFRMVASNWK